MLSLINITLSVTAFLLVLFVMTGMNTSIRERIWALEPHLNIKVQAAPSTDFLRTHPVFQKLQQYEKSQVYEFESQDILIRSMDGQFRGAVARGMSPESLQFFLSQLEKMQPHFSAVDSEIHFSKDQPAVDNGASEIIIGVDLARSLGVFEGDYVTLVPPESLLLSQGEVPRFEKVRIQKILTTNLADLDAQMIFYNRQTSLLTLQKSMALQRGLEVWLPEPEKAERYAQELRAFSDVTVETWQDRNAALFQALRLEKTTMGLFLGLASAIAGSSIITVMSLLISQKRKDIAMLVALGLSQKRILHIFTAVGSLLSGVGLFLGLFFGTGLGLYLQYFPPQILPDIYYDSKIPSQVTWFTLLVVAGSGLLVSFLGSYFPAKEASQSAAEPSRTLQGR